MCRPEGPHCVQRARVRLVLDNCEFKKAIADLDEAVRLSPRHAAAAYGNRGKRVARHAPVLQGDPRLQRSTEDRPPRSAGFFFTAVSPSTLKGETDKVLADLDEAISLDPASAALSLCGEPCGCGSTNSTRQSRTTRGRPGSTRQPPARTSGRALPGGSTVSVTRRSPTSAWRSGSTRSSRWRILTAAMSTTRKGENEKAVADPGRVLCLGSKVEGAYYDRGLPANRKRRLPKGDGRLQRGDPVEPEIHRGAHQQGDLLFPVQARRIRPFRTTRKQSRSIRRLPRPIVAVPCWGRRCATTRP